MTTFVEREIKLRYDSVASAREAVAAVGATPLRGRRLQDDRLLDWPDGRLRQDRCVLRIRDEAHSVWLTFKGPPQLATMKVREEIETQVSDAALLLTLFERLGLQVWFRYQKYREEFEHHGVIVAIDETPIGDFVELEGDEAEIATLAQAMGRTPDAYVLESYRGLFVRDRTKRGMDASHMVFDEQP